MTDKNKNIDWKLRQKVLKGNATTEDLDKLKKTDPDYYKKNIQPLIDAGNKIIITEQQSHTTLTNIVDTIIPSKDTSSSAKNTPPPPIQSFTTKPTPTPPPSDNTNISANNTPYYPDAKPVPEPGPAPEPEKPILNLPSKEKFAGEINIIKKLATTNTITTDELEQIKKLSPKTYDNIQKYIKYYNNKIKVINSKYLDAQTKTAINSANMGILTPEDLVGLSDQEITKIINLQSADITSKQTANAAEAKKVQTLIDAASLTAGGPIFYASIKGMEGIHNQVMKFVQADQNEVQPVFPEQLSAYQQALKLQNEKKSIPVEILNKLSDNEIKFLQGQYNSDTEIQHTKNQQKENLELTESGLTAAETILPILGEYLISTGLKNIMNSSRNKAFSTQEKKIIGEIKDHINQKISDKNSKKPTIELIEPSQNNRNQWTIDTKSGNLQEIIADGPIQKVKDYKWNNNIGKYEYQGIRNLEQKEITTLSKTELKNASKMKPWELMNYGWQENYKVKEKYFAGKQYRCVIDNKGKIIGTCPTEEFEKIIFCKNGNINISHETNRGFEWQVIRDSQGKILKKEKLDFVKQKDCSDIVQYALNPRKYKIIDRRMENGTVYKLVEDRQSGQLIKGYLLNNEKQLNFDLFRIGSPDNLFRKSENVFVYGQEFRVQKNILGNIKEITIDDKISSLVKNNTFSHQKKLSEVIDIMKKNESMLSVYFPKFTTNNLETKLASNYYKLQQIDKIIPETMIEELKNKGLKIIIGNDSPFLLEQRNLTQKIKLQLTPKKQKYIGFYSIFDKTANCGSIIKNKYDNVVLHEIGHAFDFLSNNRVGVSSELKQAHIEMYDKLWKYITVEQGPPGCIRGQEELFAESFANYLSFIKEHGEEIGKESFIYKYNERLYNYLNKILSPYTKK